jgi:hypothetical protein
MWAAVVSMSLTMKILARPQTGDKSSKVSFLLTLLP